MAAIDASGFTKRGSIDYRGCEYLTARALRRGESVLFQLNPQGIQRRHAGFRQSSWGTLFGGNDKPSSRSSARPAPLTDRYSDWSG